MLSLVIPNSGITGVLEGIVATFICASFIFGYKSLKRWILGEMQSLGDALGKKVTANGGDTDNVGDTAKRVENALVDFREEVAVQRELANTAMASIAEALNIHIIEDQTTQGETRDLLNAFLTGIQAERRAS